MFKPRQSNNHLPPFVYFNHGAYYYYDKKNKLNAGKKWYRLGDTFEQAMQEWAKLCPGIRKVNRMNQLFDRYMSEVAPLKSPRTYRDNISEVVNLRGFFGQMRPADVTPVHIYQYLDARGKKAPIRANREKSLLSHVFSMAIRWGIVANNPCRDVKRLPETKRDRYVTDEEFYAVRLIASPFLQCLMDFAYLTGLRQNDILNIKLSQITEAGLLVHTSKTKVKLLFDLTDELKEVVERLQAIRGHTQSEFLFCNEQGKRYTEGGIKTLWQRLIKGAHQAGIIKERFRFRDIRPKTATDMAAAIGLEEARKTLGHTSAQMTSAYIRGVQKVTPLKRSS